MSDTILEKLTVNGVNYVREGSSATAPSGKRVVMVIDRGWVYAGDVEDYKDDLGRARVRLTRVVWVFSWQGIGFEAVIEEGEKPKAQRSKVDLRVRANGARPLDFPAGAEVHRTPVSENWGL